MTFLTSACTAPTALLFDAGVLSGLNILTPRENNKVGLGKVDVTVNNSNTLSLSVNSHRVAVAQRRRRSRPSTWPSR
jgi:hypothetical protein